MKICLLLVAVFLSIRTNAQLNAGPKAAPKVTGLGNFARDGKPNGDFYYYFDDESDVGAVKARPVKRDTTFAISLENYSDSKYRSVTFEFNGTRKKSDSIYAFIRTAFNGGDNVGPYYRTYIFNYGDTLQVHPYRMDNANFCDLNGKNFYTKLTEREVDGLFTKH